MGGGRQKGNLTGRRMKMEALDWVLTGLFCSQNNLIKEEFPLHSHSLSPSGSTGLRLLRQRHGRLRFSTGLPSCSQFFHLTK